MKRVIKIGKGQIELSKPFLGPPLNSRVIGLGKCKTGSQILRGGKTITFYPVVEFKSVKQARKVLDALGLDRKIKVEHLQLHLSTILGRLVFTVDPSVLEPYRKCYDYRWSVSAIYVHCTAKVGKGAKKMTFEISYPVEVHSLILGTPNCCPDEPELGRGLPTPEPGPGKDAEKLARELYEKARKDLEDMEREMLEDFGDFDGEEFKWKLGMPGDFKPKAKWGLNYDFDEVDKPDDKPVIRIRPRWKF